MNQTFDQRTQNLLSKSFNLIPRRVIREKELFLLSREIRSSIIQLIHSVSIEFIDFTKESIRYEFQLKKGASSDYCKEELKDSGLTQHQFAKGFFDIKFPKGTEWFIENEGVYLLNNVNFEITRWSSIDKKGWREFLDNLIQFCFNKVSNNYKDDIVKCLESILLNHPDPLIRLLVSKLSGKVINYPLSIFDLRLPESRLRKLLPNYFLNLDELNKQIIDNTTDSKLVEESIDSIKKILINKKLRWQNSRKVAKDRKFKIKLLKDFLLKENYRVNLGIIDEVVEELKVCLYHSNLDNTSYKRALIFSWGEYFQLIIPYDFKEDQVFFKQVFLKGNLLESIDYNPEFQHLKDLERDYNLLLKKFQEFGIHISDVEKSLNSWIRLFFYTTIVESKYKQDNSYLRYLEENFDSYFLPLIKSKLQEKLSSDPGRDLTFMMINFLFNSPNQESFQVNNFKFKELDNMSITNRFIRWISSLTYNPLKYNLINKTFHQCVKYCYYFTYGNYWPFSLAVCSLWIYIEGYQGITHTGLLLTVIPFLIRQLYLPIITELEKEVALHLNISKEEKVKYCENKIKREELEYQYWTELNPSKNYNLDEILQIRLSDYQTTKILVYQDVPSKQIEEDKIITLYRSNSQSWVENFLTHFFISNDISDKNNSIMSSLMILGYNSIASHPFQQKNYLRRSLEKNTKNMTRIPLRKETGQQVSLKFSLLSSPYYSLILYGIQLTVLMLLVFMLVAQLHNQNKGDDGKISVSPMSYLIV